MRSRTLGLRPCSDERPAFESMRWQRTELPKVLAISKREYHGKLADVAKDALQMVFGA